MAGAEADSICGPMSSVVLLASWGLCACGHHAGEEENGQSNEGASMAHHGAPDPVRCLQLAPRGRTGKGAEDPTIPASPRGLHLQPTPSRFPRGCVMKSTLAL